MAKDVLKQRDPLKKEIKKQKHAQPSSAQSNTDANVSSVDAVAPNHGSTVHRTISVQVRRFVFHRDQVCQHRKSDGSLCGSKYQLELDHIHPKFAGGSDHAENLRLLCRIHNADRYRTGA